MGHKWNFGIPGLTADNWFKLVSGTGENDDLGFYYPATKSSLQDELLNTPVVVIMLGANDLKQQYNDIFNNSENPGFFNQTRNRIKAVHDWVRLNRGAHPPK